MDSPSIPSAIRVLVRKGPTAEVVTVAETAARTHDAFCLALRAGLRRVAYADGDDVCVSCGIMGEGVPHTFLECDALIERRYIRHSPAFLVYH